MNSKSKYTILTYLFLLLTIFTLFIFTKNFYYDFKVNRENIKSLTQELAQKNEEYQKLSDIKLAIDSGKSDIKNFDKFLINFDEDEITNYFYEYANNNIWDLKIDSISLSQGKLNEFWFMESQIDIIASFAWEEDMINMLNFVLTSEKYNFYIHEFNYPLWNIKWPFSVTIPLKVLYK